MSGKRNHFWKWRKNCPMSKRICFGEDEKFLAEAVDAYLQARYPLALTGAGISVESGIPDFRSPGGLWSIYDPGEYATIEVFYDNPEKAWQFYRVMAETLQGKDPNDAHLALVRLEQAGLLKGIITQNIDGLHERAGSRTVMLIHGDGMHLQCVKCHHRIPAVPEYYTGDTPRCEQCNAVLKPDYVLFGEPVRAIDLIQEQIKRCDALLVIGTSCQVYPAAIFPSMVKSRNGIIMEFNLVYEPGEAEFLPRLPGAPPTSDYFFHGKATVTVSRFVREVLSGT